MSDRRLAVVKSRKSFQATHLSQSAWLARVENLEATSPAQAGSLIGSFGKRALTTSDRGAQLDEGASVPHQQHIDIGCRRRRQASRCCSVITIPTLREYSTGARPHGGVALIPCNTSSAHNSDPEQPAICRSMAIHCPISGQSKHQPQKFLCRARHQRGRTRFGTRGACNKGGPNGSDQRS